MKLPRVLKTLPRLFALAALSTLLALPCVVEGQGRNARRASRTSATPDAFTRPDLVRRYERTITPAALSAHLRQLASDSFEGREATTRGQKLAAQYLAAQYRLLGLAPKGSLKTADASSHAAYFQPFRVYKRQPKATRLELFVRGSRVASSDFSAETQDDLSYFETGDLAGASGGVVFAGYGIADDQLGYNDYAALASQGISVEGKWLLIFEGEPLADAETSLLPTPGRKPSKWSTQFVNKRRALWSAGRPAGLLVLKDASPRFQGTFADAAARAARHARRPGNFRLTPSSPFPPTYAISSKLAERLLSPSGRTVEELRREIDGSLKPTVFEVGGVHVKASVEQFDALETENVLAFVEGSDPRLKDEVVVISSHYDGLGTDPSLAGDKIYNGAADDASGVAASLELARAFVNAKREGRGPRRSLLFVNFSAEEKGLLGSFHYAQREPVVPLEQTVANVNMDGVGGIDLRHPTGSRNYVYVNGDPSLSSELFEINRRVKGVTRSSVELTDGPGFNSDDKNFQAQLIPFIYFSTGLTEHFHTPRDEADTIDYEHLSRVARLVFANVWQLANQQARPRAVDRSRLKAVGYACPPCPFECDAAVYERPGECPVCGMPLTRKYDQPAATRAKPSGVKARPASRPAGVAARLVSRARLVADRLRHRLEVTLAAGVLHAAAADSRAATSTPPTSRER